MKLFWRLACMIIGLVPISVVAYWGATYFWSCLLVASAPGTNVSFPLSTEGGTLLIRAETYAVDPIRGEASLTGIEVLDPEGSKLLSARSAIVFAPHVLRLSDSFVRVKVRDAFARIERDELGKFNFEKYFPGRETKEKPTPFDIEIDHLSLGLHDRLPQTDQGYACDLNQVRFASASNDFVMSTEIILEKGKAHLDALLTRDSLGTVRAKLDGVELAPYWSHLLALPTSAQWGDVRSIAAQSVIASGTFEVGFAPKKPATIRCKPRLVFHGLRSVWWDRAISGTYEGWLTERGAGGIFKAVDGGLQAEFHGQAAWASGFSALGGLRATASSTREVPKAYASMIPKGVSASGIEFGGSLHVSNGKFDLDGKARARQANWKQELVSEIVGTLHLDEGGGVAHLQDSKYLGVSGNSGSVSWNYGDNKLAGRFKTAPLPLAPIFARFTKERIEGNGTVDVLLGGTLSQPIATARASGAIEGRPMDGASVQRANFSLAARWAGESIVIQRCLATSRLAIVTADGSIGLNPSSLALNAKVVGVDLSDLLDNAGGLLTANFRITGDWQHPVAKGRAELLNSHFEGEPIPILVSDLNVDRRKALLTNFSAVRGASRLDGHLTYTFESGGLDGEAEGNGLQLADFLGKDFGGSVSLKKTTIRGTASEPLIETAIEGSDLILNKVRIAAVSASASLAENVATVDDWNIRMGKGAWKGSGWYNLSTKSGSFSGEAEVLDLAKMTPVLGGEYVVNGIISGTARASWEAGQLATANLDGEVDDLILNQVRIGNGTFTSKLSSGHWSGNVDIGFAERFVQIPEFSYSPESREVKAQLVLLGLPIREVFQGTENLLTSSSLEPAPGAFQVPESGLDFMRRLDGQLSLDATVTGDVERLALDITSLTLSKLEVSNSKAGDISLQARRDPGGMWNINELKWSGGPGSLMVTGSIQEQGEIAIQGDLYNFDLPWLSLFDERLAKLKGVASASFDASGDTATPKVMATISASLLPLAKKEGDNSPTEFAIGAAIGPLTVSDNGIEFEGDLNARGIRGGIEGRIPFKYPFTIPTNEELHVAVAVPKRKQTPIKTTEESLDLKQFAGEVPNLILGGEEHSLRAFIKLGGTAEDLDVSGSAEARLDELGWRGIETALKDVGIQASVAKGQLLVQAKATNKSQTNGPGELAANLSLNISDILTRFDTDPKALLASKVSGKFSAENFRIREQFMAGGLADLIVDADLRLSGSLESPKISTILPARLREVNATMPSAFPELEEGNPPRIDPRFAISYVVANPIEPARFRASTASFSLHGSGTLQGTLSAPNMSTGLEVDSGSIRLPNARVSIEDGGKARLAYRGSAAGTSDLRLDVDLHGRTGLSSVNFTGTVQRYEVDLAIRGNILDESSQTITARSDPPDLDQNQILNLLGQRELFEGLAGQFFGQTSSHQLASTLAGVAVPALFDPVTAKLAQDLGLEFLTLEYNAFEGATITAAKSLGSGLLLQGRRQLGETIENRIHYDFRLTWRPNSRFAQVRNLIWSIGTDQDRPWKISVEYGIRF